MVLPRLNSVETSIFTASEGGWGRASGIGCAVEVRDRPELFRVVVRIDRGFETTGIEPWTCLLSPAQGRFLPVLAFFGVKSVTLQVVLTLPQQRLHYSPRLLPIPPTYKLNGPSFGRPDVDLKCLPSGLSTTCRAFLLLFLSEADLFELVLKRLS